MSTTSTSVVIGQAWKATFRAMGRMPDVFAVSIVLLFTLPVAGAWVLQTWFTHLGSPIALAHSTMIGWLHPIIMELSSVPLALAAIAVHRSVLLTEDSYLNDLLNIRLLRFLFWPVVLQLVFLFTYGASIVLTFSVLPYAPYLLLLPLIVLLYVIAVRCSLIFPAIAVGEDGSLGTSWALTRGRAWRICWLLLWGLVPIVVFQLAAARVFGSFMPRGGEMFSWLSIAHVFLTATIQVMVAGVLAAILSWIYAEAREL